MTSQVYVPLLREAFQNHYPLPKRVSVYANNILAESQWAPSCSHDRLSWSPSYILQLSKLLQYRTFQNPVIRSQNAASTDGQTLPSNVLASEEIDVEFKILE